MNATSDNLGDLLRQFYATYGMPHEGPPGTINVSALFPGGIPQSDLQAMRAAIDDQGLRREFGICREILDDLATRLSSEGVAS